MNTACQTTRPRCRLRQEGKLRNGNILGILGCGALCPRTSTSRTYHLLCRSHTAVCGIRAADDCRQIVMVLGLDVDAGRRFRSSSFMLHEGFADVSFRFGGRRGWRAIGLGLLVPIIVGVFAYGIAWTTGLVQFRPQPISLVASFVGETASRVVVLLVNLLVAATIVTIFSARTAAGEEIGWRGYMLTRLIDAGVPAPILVSGLIWGTWHVPLILGGVYLAGPPPALAALLWMATATALSFVFAKLRFETGSVWPAITLHAAWNAIIQTAFDPASGGRTAALWIG